MWNGRVEQILETILGEGLEGNFREQSRLEYFHRRSVHNLLQQFISVRDCSKAVFWFGNAKLILNLSVRFISQLWLALDLHRLLKTTSLSVTQAQQTAPLRSCLSKTLEFGCTTLPFVWYNPSQTMKEMELNKREHYAALFWPNQLIFSIQNLPERERSKVDVSET